MRNSLMLSALILIPPVMKAIISSEAIIHMSCQVIRGRSEAIFCFSLPLARQSCLVSRCPPVIMSLVRRFFASPAPVHSRVKSFWLVKTVKGEAARKQFESLGSQGPGEASSFFIQAIDASARILGSIWFEVKADMACELRAFS